MLGCNPGTMLYRSIYTGLTNGSERRQDSLGIALLFQGFFASSSLLDDDQGSALRVVGGVEDRRPADALW